MQLRLVQQKFGGLLTRKERWGLSGRGWLVLIVAALGISGLAIVNAYSFLAVTDRVPAGVLVVEGWVHPYAIRAAVQEFRARGYNRIFTTGGPVVGKGGYVNDFQTAASVGAELLVKEGIPKEVVQMVPTRVIGRDRTYSSAIALKEWLRAHDSRVQAVNIITEGTHARRTRLLFQEALGKDVKVGVISVPSPDFDAAHWWSYSEGAEDVVGEGFAYIYAKLFFFSDEVKPKGKMHGN